MNKYEANFNQKKNSTDIDICYLKSKKTPRFFTTLNKYFVIYEMNQKVC